MTMSKVIDKRPSADVTVWTTPGIYESAANALRGAPHSGAHLLTAQQLDELQAQAQEEARKTGFEQGLSAGKAELEQRVLRLEALIAALASPFEDLDTAVEQQLVELSVVLAEQVLTREIETDRRQILAAVRDCLRALPCATRDIRLQLNPEDADLLRQYAEDGELELSFRIQEDPSRERGSLMLHSDTVSVDGSLESRLRDIIAVALDPA